MTFLFLNHLAFFIPHALHHFALGSSLCIYARSRGVGTGSSSEQAQVDEFTNLSLDQGKPWCIQLVLLVFFFNLALCYSWLCIKLIGLV
jgi:hypothetical protein